MAVGTGGPEGTRLARPYPVRVDGRLDASLSRWLWLVKFVLVIPHAIVLVFLWLAAIAVTVAAFFCILVARRYPRSLFDFVVGVMRWSWRVAFWSFDANGTDRYPPFRLADDPTYPARLQVDYPERLSRGLVLVKWWLLAIPHLLIVAFFAGGSTLSWTTDTGTVIRVASTGLIGLVVFLAVVALLFTGRYPGGLFDFVMGMNRWCLRVGAYVLLLRDDYPPFRFDAGGIDPGSVAASVPFPPPRPPVAPPVSDGR